jgi:hypothetical protein
VRDRRHGRAQLRARLVLAAAVHFDADWSVLLLGYRVTADIDNHRFLCVRHRGRTAPVAAPCAAAAAAAAAFLLQLFRSSPAAASASAAAAAAVAAAPASACAPAASRRNQPCLSHHVPALPPLSAGGASVLSYSQGGGRLAGYSSSATWCQPSANYLIDFTLGCYSCSGSDTTWPWCVDRQ